MNKCTLCGKPLVGKDIHNAAPLTKGCCCGKCNISKVVPARMAEAKGEKTCAKTVNSGQ